MESILQRDIATARALARFMDEQFSIGRFKFGLDPLIGLFFGAGDAAGLLVSLYIFGLGLKHEPPQSKLLNMLGNIVIDFVIGDLFDFGIKENSKNLKLLEGHLRQNKTSLSTEH